MRIGLRFLLLSPLAALLACGGSPTVPVGLTTPTTPAYNFNGTWKAVATSSNANFYPVSGLSGSLQVANGAVTGTLTATGSSSLCTALNTPLTVTGTLDSNQDLTLTFPIASGTGTLLAALANNPANFTYGSWTVAGGACAMSVTPMVIQQTSPTTPPPTAVPATITASLSGNWAIAANYNSAATAATEPMTGFLGALQFSNGSVSGILNAVPFTTGVCAGYIAVNGGTVTVTGGVLDASNNLVLTFPIAGGEASINAALGSNPQTLAYGSFQINGGSCAIGATPMTIAQYAPLTGTYTGTFNLPNAQSNVPVANSSISVTAVLTQATTSNSLGQFPITGNITVTGACTDSVSFAGFTSGDTFNYSASPYFTGSFDPTASNIYSAVYQSTHCTTSYQGTLTRQ
jgi:hypothetical protein